MLVQLLIRELQLPKCQCCQLHAFSNSKINIQSDRERQREGDSHTANVTRNRCNSNWPARGTTEGRCERPFFDLYGSVRAILAFCEFFNRRAAKAGSEQCFLHSTFQRERASAQACVATKPKHSRCLACTRTVVSAKSTPKQFSGAAASRRFWQPGGDYNNSTPNELCNFLRRRVCTLNFVDPTKWAAEFNEHCKLTEKMASRFELELNKYCLQKTFQMERAFVEQRNYIGKKYWNKAEKAKAV